MFLPECFGEWIESPFDLIPQDGGDHQTGHRCAREWITIETMKAAMDLLAHQMDFEVSEHDLSYDLIQMPKLSKSGFIIRNVSQREL